VSPANNDDLVCVLKSPLSNVQSARAATGKRRRSVGECLGIRARYARVVQRTRRVSISGVKCQCVCHTGQRGVKTGRVRRL